MTRITGRSQRRAGGAGRSSQSRAARGIWRTALRLTVLLTLPGCSTDCPGIEPSETPRPAVAGVIIVPNEVWVDASSTTTFSLRALVDLTDGTRHEARSSEVTWKADVPSDAFRVRQNGARGSVQVKNAMGDAATVSVTANGKTASAKVFRYPVGSMLLPGQKMVVAPHTPGDLPSVAMVSGWHVDRCVDQPVSFVKTGLVLAVTASPVGASPCRADMTILSPSTAVWHQEAAAGVYPQPIGPSTSTAPTLIQARVIIGVTDSYCPDSWSEYCYHLNVVQGGATDLMLVSKDLANEIFSNAGTGVQIGLRLDEAKPELYGVTGCSSVPTTGDFAPKPREITIYVVDETYSGEDLAYGVACPDYSADPRPVILIGYRYARFWSTLAHEFTHLLGHRWPLHVNEGITGMGDYNVMATVEQAGVDRFHLTVGQAYRMALDGRSWLNFLQPAASPKTCSCTNAGKSSPCPTLARDVKPMEKPVTISAPVCAP